MPRVVRVATFYEPQGTPSACGTDVMGDSEARGLLAAWRGLAGLTRIRFGHHFDSYTVSNYHFGTPATLISVGPAIAHMRLGCFILLDVQVTPMPLSRFREAFSS